MTTKEAIQAMLYGKNLKHDKMGNGVDYVFFDIGLQMFMMMCRDVASGYVFIYHENEALNWEIYQELKPKEIVTIGKWLCQYSGDGEYRIFESSMIEIIDGGWERIKLLETYEVEL